MRLTQDVASETRPRRDKPLNYVRVRDETESLGTLGLETETRPRLSSLSGAWVALGTTYMGTGPNGLDKVNL